ncbi:MAG TPA: TM2 domain-containing protein [Trichocoleus sp.]|jgi:TM2 domain-containing membrane protein YozV
MSPQNALELARQGNTQAIAALMNQTLQAKGATARVIKNDDCLKILLEAREVPNQVELVKFISGGIRKLEVAGITTLQVFGRRIGDNTSSWSQTVALKEERSQHIGKQQPHSSSQHRERSPISDHETAFKVKHDGQELVASNVNELKQWLHEGRISPADYTYNPILERWMYVRELAEIESVVKQQESTTKAQNYNQMSFVFAGLGLLMLLVFPPAGAVLLIIGIVFSAFYYAQKGSSSSSNVTSTHKTYHSPPSTQSHYEQRGSLSSSNATTGHTAHYASSPTQSSISRVTTGVLAILFGGLGIHFFYMNAWGWGLISLLFCWTYLPMIAGLIFGIRYLSMSDKEFERKAKQMRSPFGPIIF